jgi:hypothetical protein
LPIAALAAIAVAIVVGTLRAADAPPAKDETTREIFVPFSELNVLLENQPRRVMLSREEYDDLVKKARKTPVTGAPHPALLLSADYTASAGAQRASVTGTLAIEVLEEGLHALPLDLAGVGLLAAKLDGKDAAIGRAPDGRLNLLIEGVGRRQLVLDMVCPLESNAAQQVLNFRLPRAPIGRVQLSVPGDVEIRSGADVVSRTVDTEARVTRFELLPRSGDTTLVMSLNSHLQRQQQAVAARCVVVHEVASAYEKLHATATLAVLHRAVDRARFVVPDGFEITEISSPLLARWDVETDGPRKVANVRLREPTTETVVLAIAAIKSPCDLKDWRLPRLEMLDVVSQVTVVGLLTEPLIKAESLVPEDLVSVDASVLDRAIPSTLRRSEPGAAPLRAVAAYYAPHSRFSLAARFRKPPATLAVATNVVLTLADEGCRVRGQFVLSPETEKLFGFDFSVPPGWQVTEVTGPDGKPLAIERRAAPGGAGRICVRVPEGIAPRADFPVTFFGLHVPSAWLGEWKTQQVDFPVFRVADVSRDEGAVAVAVADDLMVRSEKLDRLVPLTDPEKAKYRLSDTATILAYRYEGPEYKATLAVERTQPRLTARTYSFFQIKPDGLAAHHELHYRVEEARTRRLALLLPQETPEALSITGLAGLQLKEFSSEPAGKFRRWNVELAEALRDNLRLAVDFHQPLRRITVPVVPKDGKTPGEGTSEKNDADQRTSETLILRELPIVRAEGVAYQSGLVAVEGSPELDVQVRTDARRVDAGQLAGAEHQPGRRLLGAYGFVGEPPAVTADAAHHPGYLLAPAIVERAELTTLLSADGRSQTQANFRLRTKASYLEVKLPEEAELWSAQLGSGDRDSTALKPQREGDCLLIGLPASPVETVRTLQLVFAAPVASIGVGGKVKMKAPKLLLRGAVDQEAQEVPLVNLAWRLRVPEGFEVVESGGTLATDDLRKRRPPAAPLAVAGALYALAGGVDPFYCSRPGKRAARSNKLSQYGMALKSMESAKTAASADEFERFDIGDPEDVPPSELDVDTSLEKARPARKEDYVDDSAVHRPKAGGMAKSGETKTATAGGLGVGLGTGKGAGTGGDGAGFGGRGEGHRKAMLAQAGGTKHTERIATSALLWLARHQDRADGSWNFQGYTRQCKDGGATCTGPGTGTGDAGATAVCLLPFLAAGQTHKSKGPYQKTIADGLNWLVRHQKPDGNLAPDDERMMSSHGMAATALCEAYGLTGDRVIGLAAQGALKFIVSSQNKQTGGWGQKPGETGDTAVLGWQVMALKSAAKAGLSISGANEALAGAAKWLDACAKGPSGSQYSSEPGGAASLEMTAVGLLCRQHLGANRDSPVAVEGMKFLLQNLPDAQSRDVGYWYYGTQVMHNMPGYEWDQWNRAVRRTLVESQCKDSASCAGGSWEPAADEWGQYGGRVMTTALSALTLGIYYRYLPLFKTPNTVAADREIQYPRDTTSLGEAIAEGEKKEKAGEAPSSLQPEPALAAKPSYTLKGTRSLKIDLQQAPEDEDSAITFRSLGEEPELVVTLAQRTRYGALGWGLALAVGLVGVARTNRSVRAKTALVLGIGLVAVLVPLVWDNAALAWVCNMLFFAASLLVPYYLLVGLVKWLVAGMRRTPPSTAQRVVVAATAMVLIACLLAQAGNAGESGNGKLETCPTPVNVPDDAIILPYDPQAGAREADRLLVPYARYVELWNLAHPDRKIEVKPAPVGYAWAGASYQATLEGDESITLAGRMEIDVFVDGYATVPLSLRNAVLVRAELDGKPARLGLAAAPRGPQGGPPVADDPFGPPPVPHTKPEPVVRPPAPQPKPAPDGPFADDPVPAPQKPPAKPAAAVGQVSNLPANASAPPPPPPPPDTPAESLLVLHVSGKGRHKLDIEVRLRLARQGGWRVARGVLPSAPATELAVRVPKTQTELRLGQPADRRSHETQKADETVRTALGPGGELDLQWRAQVAEGQVDRGLTAQSTAVFDVREDGLRLTWQLKLEFPRSQRERFTVSAPKEYLVEKVVGANVRGWEPRQAEKEQTVEISLLQPAKDREQFTLHLSRSGKVGPEKKGADEKGAVRPDAAEPEEFDVPVVAVSEASLSSGQVTVRRSPLLDVRTVRRAGVTRIDLGGDLPQGTGGGAEEAVLCARPSEAYHFATMPFTLRLSVTPVEARVTADVQLLVKAAEREPGLEGRVVLHVAERPIYAVRLRVPDDLEQAKVAMDCPCQWTIAEEAAERQDGAEKAAGAAQAQDGKPGEKPAPRRRKVLCVYMPLGQQGDVPIHVSGTLAPPDKERRLALPRLEVCDALRQQGDVAVQADPAFDVRASDLSECQEVELARAATWLSAQQREATRLVLHYGQPVYQATLRLVPRKADVTCDTITNVRVTDRAIEETIYLNFHIRGAGVRRLSFSLPARMADSRFTVPMLRQKTIVFPSERGLDPPADYEPPPVRVTLELQDDVMNDFRVLVENDRMITAGTHTAPVPFVPPEVARTNRQYVTIEPAGRDEVVVESQAGLDSLGRQQREWQTLSNILGNRLWRAWLVSSNADDHRLSFKTVRREDVQTAGARIDWARTVLVLDANGAYRAAATFSLDNATEQFLEVEMPEGARLWTVHVAGDPSKPVVIADPKGDRLCIPILKTARGDTNHSVVLKYGGKLPAIGALGSVRFPVVKTQKVNVEQSWLDLHLPESHRWFGFAGTMHPVAEEAEVAAGEVARENKEMQRLIETAKQGDAFAKARARSNLKTVIDNQNKLQSSVGRYGRNEQLQNELDANSRFAEQAKELLNRPDESQQSAAQAEADNRWRLNDLVGNQEIARSHNVIQGLGKNWEGQVRVDDRRTSAGGSLFNRQWFEKNSLALEDGPASGPGRGTASDKPSGGQQAATGKTAASPYYLSDDVTYTPPRPQGAEQHGKSQTEKAGEATVAAKRPASSSVRPQRDQEQEDLGQFLQKLRQQQGAARQAVVMTDGTRTLDEAFGQVIRGPAVAAIVDRSESMAKRDAVVIEGREPPSDAPAPAMGGRGAAVPTAGTVQAGAAPLPTGLASLDFELPIGGRVYHFTTPRGEVELNARAISQGLVVKLGWLAMVAVAAFLVWYDVRLLRRARFGWLKGPAGAAVLLIVGVVSLIAGVLPIAGLVAVGIGAFLVARLLVLRRKPDAAPPAAIP